MFIGVLDENRLDLVILHLSVSLVQDTDERLQVAGRHRGGLSQVQGGSGDSTWLLGDKSVLQQRQLIQVAKGVLEVNVATLDVPAVGVLVVKPRHKRKVVEKRLGGDGKKSKGEVLQDLGHCSMFRGPEYVCSTTHN